MTKIKKLTKKLWWQHKIYTTKVKVLPICENRISTKLYDQQLFFILSTGRTGTKWMSEILSFVEGANVLHEPIPAEAYAHLEAMNDDIKAEKYVRTVKQKDIFIKISQLECVIYGEVNGNLRRHIPFLRKYFHNAKFLHLVRDGRKVVRSLLARNTFRGNHQIFGFECPIPLKELNQKWSTLNEFEKSCWAWKEENKYLRSQISDLARLEDITSSYKAFQLQVLEPLDLTLSESDWKKYADKRVNKSMKNRKRLDEEWSEEQNNIFESICGNEMRALGYY
jgi:hypothetical protein